MTKYIFTALLFVASLSFGQSYSRISNTSAVKSKINAKAKSTTSISANFSEEVHSSMFNSSKKASGKLNYKQSDKIRWEHISPKKQIIETFPDKVLLFVGSISNTSVTFFVRVDSFVKLFFPVESNKKQIRGKINNKNKTTLFLVKNFIGFF